MNNIGSSKLKNARRIFRNTILCVVLVSGICYMLYRVDRMQKVKQAVQMYQEFLAGERKAGNIDIDYLITPTHEPERRYRTGYTIVDSNGDGIPELHILSGREYTIYSCKDNEMYEFNAFFSKPWWYVPLNNGAFIFTDYTGMTTMGDAYYYFELDASGNRINELKFSWMDANENLLCDDDEFMFHENSCTKDEWFAKTRKYLFTDEEGREQIRNQAEWTVYCEEIW